MPDRLQGDDPALVAEALAELRETWTTELYAAAVAVLLDCKDAPAETAAGKVLLAWPDEKHDRLPLLVALGVAAESDARWGEQAARRRMMDAAQRARFE